MPTPTIDSELETLAGQRPVERGRSCGVAHRGVGSNGHSNSLSALMEIPDLPRFTRGVRIDGDSPALRHVMVRRVKRALRSANPGTFPLRRVICLELEGPNDELQLGAMVSEYTELMRPKKGRGQLVSSILRILCSAASKLSAVRSTTLHRPRPKGGRRPAKKTPPQGGQGAMGW